ncbi:MAG TPA: excinuclease ABC subunit UvrC [Thermoleophilia bacterium]|nr:excinuclease ABC subunit UvrC [Thermoleophilia bacterium]
MEDLREQIQHSPDLPGVYLYRDASGTVIYVGKALSLKKRLCSYLPALPGGDAARLSVKVAEMVQRATGLEWIVTTNEGEALLLEHNLIKQHRPAFNIRLRDDKSYPYIVVTVEDDFPRVMFTRQPHRRGNLYFGPFSSAAKVRETLDILGRVFPLRECRGKTPGRHSGSPCLQFHIKRCAAPCLGDVGAEDYRAVLSQVVDFLSGRQTKVLSDLRFSMRNAADRRDFEAAAAFRDRAEALEHVLERQQIESSSLGSSDIIGLATDSWGANVQVFITRDGKLADRRSFTMVNVEGADEEEVFTRFVGEYYASTPSVPAELIVPGQITNPGELATFLEGLRGTKVEVRKAERGDKRRLQELADRNAALALAHERARDERSRERRLEALASLQESLRLPATPVRIEGFDISNLGDENIVASMVVFEGGAPRKSHYRKFSIRTTARQDDVGAMHEALGRRFARAAEDGAVDRYDPSFEAVPDLVLIDGGKGQLGAALAALQEAGLAGAVPVVSLAKREEEVFTPWSPEPLSLPADHPGLLLLERVRDEAHRFAIGFHRSKRAAQTTESFLDQLPGVGEKRKRAIVQYFGSPERFLQATREELEAVPGLPGKVAREIHAYVHKTG